MTLDAGAMLSGYKYQLFSSLMHIKARGGGAEKKHVSLCLRNIHMEITASADKQQKWC